MDESQKPKEFKLDYINLSIDRSLVIHISTQIEFIINNILSWSLGFTGTENYSFGTTSKALSFNAKIILLLDFEGISKNDQKHFVKLAEIRNQFAHNYLIENFTSLESNDNGQQAIKHLESCFSAKIDRYSRTNDNLKRLFIYLSLEITEIVNRVLRKIESKALEIGETHGAIEWHKIVKRLMTDESYIKTFSGDQLDGVMKLLNDVNAKFQLYQEEVSKNEGSLIKGKKLM